eukprot:GFUD01058701.1.p2 GENE.GFUD01058701.1~~GFUD01058701.1.p2  ORF type:complete len:103 (+),score=18.96 GFUD01058701.1:78-386(+)
MFQFKKQLGLDNSWNSATNINGVQIFVQPWEQSNPATLQDQDILTHVTVANNTHNEGTIDPESGHNTIAHKGRPQPRPASAGGGVYHICTRTRVFHWHLGQI